MKNKTKSGRKKNRKKIMISSVDCFKSGSYVANGDQSLRSEKGTTFEPSDFTVLRTERVEDIAPSNSIPIQKVSISRTHTLTLVSDGRVILKPLNLLSTGINHNTDGTERDKKERKSNKLKNEKGLKSKKHKVTKLNIKDLNASHIVFAPGLNSKNDDTNSGGKYKNMIDEKATDIKQSNFEKIASTSGWLFCDPTAEHIALDLKRRNVKNRPSRINTRSNRNNNGKEKKHKSDKIDKEKQGKGNEEKMKKYAQLVQHWKTMTVKNYRKIVSIACGNEHYVMTSGVLDGHRLFAFGKNNRGQLGLGDYKDREIPTVVSYFSATNNTNDGIERNQYLSPNKVYVKTISCGCDYTLCSALNVLTGITSIFAWGSRNDHPPTNQRIQINQGRPYTLLFTNDKNNHEHLNAREDVCEPVETLVINYTGTDSEIGGSAGEIDQKNYSPMLDDLLNNDDEDEFNSNLNNGILGTCIANLPAKLRSPRLKVWLESSYLSWINAMTTMIGTEWYELMDDGTYNFNRKWLSIDMSNLSNNVILGSKSKEKHAHDMLMTKKALHAFERHINMIKGLCNDICKISGVDYAFPDSVDDKDTERLEHEIANVLNEMELDMHTVDTNLQKKKEDLAEIQHLLLILQLQKQHVTNKIKNSMKTVETIKACNVRKQESTMYANKTDSNSKMINNDKKKPMRNTYYLSMKPVSIQSLRKTRTGFSSSSNNNYNVGSSSKNISGDIHDFNTTKDGGLLSLFDPQNGELLPLHDIATQLQNEKPSRNKLEGISDLKKELEKIETTTMALKRDQSRIHEGAKTKEVEKGHIEKQRDVLLSALNDVREFDKDSSLVSGSNNMANKERKNDGSSLLNELPHLESLWGTTSRLAPDSLSVLHSQLRNEIEKQCHTSDNANSNDRISPSGGVESIVSKQVKYEDNIYEVKPLKRCQYVGLSDVSDISNSLLHYMFKNQITGKYDMAKNRMKTDVAYPYALYLEMFCCTGSKIIIT